MLFIIPVASALFFEVLFSSMLFSRFRLHASRFLVYPALTKASSTLQITLPRTNLIRQICRVPQDQLVTSAHFPGLPSHRSGESFPIFHVSHPQLRCPSLLVPQRGFERWQPPLDLTLWFTHPPISTTTRRHTSLQAQFTPCLNLVLSQARWLPQKSTLRPRILHLSFLRDLLLRPPLLQFRARLVDDLDLPLRRKAQPLRLLWRATSTSRGRLPCRHFRLTQVHQWALLGAKRTRSSAHPSLHQHQHHQGQFPPDLVGTVTDEEGASLLEATFALGRLSLFSARARQSRRVAWHRQCFNRRNRRSDEAMLIEDPLPFPAMIYHPSSFLRPVNS